METWKEIPNTDGYYYVSNLGNVKSGERSVADKNGRIVHYKERLIKPNVNSKGYYRVRIIVAGKKVNPFVHRLVAGAFVNHAEGKDVVNHIDCNPKNNSAENLEWVTPLENMQYASRLGRMKYSSTHRQRLKESLDRVMGKPVIGTPISGGNPIRYNAVNDTKKDGFQSSCVSQCCNGIRNYHKGYYWRFDEKQKNESS
jgi:hypothetical protein